MTINPEHLHKIRNDGVIIANVLLDLATKNASGVLRLGAKQSAITCLALNVSPNSQLIQDCVFPVLATDPGRPIRLRALSSRRHGAGVDH